MLSLRELERAAGVLDARLREHRLDAVVQPDATSVVLVTRRSGGGRAHVLLSCRPGMARVSVLARRPQAPPSPPAFCQLLRARVTGARIGPVRLLDADRQLALRLVAREEAFDLVLSILGPRSNVVLLDADGRVVSALRPLADTRPELAVGVPWRAPDSRLPTAGEDRFEGASDEDYLEAIEAAYTAREAEDDERVLRGRVERALRKEAKALDRKLEKLTRELALAREAVTLERKGELLKSVLSEVKKGDATAVARDFETGEEVSIPLEPTLAPAENLALLFKRYRKGVRALARAGAREDSVRGASDAIAALAAELEGVAGGDAVAAFAAREDVAVLVAKRAPGPPPRRHRDADRKLGKHRVPARLVPRRYRTAGDLEIWVGRSDAGNDHLTTRLARGVDLFFHLDGAPGSHVVLRTEGRSDPPDGAVLDACELAVHFSKHRKITRADVHVVPIKNVRKPRGAKPGLVEVHGGRSVRLRRDAARLERVLGARIED